MAEKVVIGNAELWHGDCREVLPPLFGDFTGKTGSTIWVTYLKTTNANVTGLAPEGD